MLKDGAASSLLIVPVALALAIVAPAVALLSMTEKVSSDSNSASAVVWTVKVLVDSPLAKFNAPETALKSFPLAELPAAMDVA